MLFFSLCTGGSFIGSKILKKLKINPYHIHSECMWKFLGHFILLVTYSKSIREVGVFKGWAEGIHLIFPT